MKKKSLFRKATALICCIAMCITTFMPAIYAVAGKSQISLTVSDGVKLYDSEGKEIVDTGEVADTYSYTRTGNEIIFEGETNKDSYAFSSGDSVELYTDETNKPEITSLANGSKVEVAISEYKEGTFETFKWKIVLKITGNLSRGGANLAISRAKTQYTVSFSSTDCDILNKDNGAALNGIYTYNEDDVINFTVDAGSQLGKTVAVLKNRSESLTAKNGVYSVTVNSNMTISAKVNDEVLGVTGPKIEEQVGYTYTPASSESVTYGGSFSFYVTPADGWTVPTVKNGNTVLTSVGNNLYVINNITEPVTIKVEAGSLVQHSVVYPTGVGYTARGKATVTNGSVLEFTVAPSDVAYEIKSVTATVGGKAAKVDPVEGKTNTYTISEVNGDVVISVNAQKKVYDITITQENKEGMTVNTPPATNIEHGTQYTFYVTPKAGYSDAKVYVNDSTTPTDPVNGTQYVVNVTGTTTIKIVGGSLNSYNVTLNKGVGFDYDSNTTSVKHNGTYTFKVKVKDAYSKSEPVVTVNNVVIDGTKAAESNVWTYEIPKVTENKIVSVSGLQINTYKVTLNGGVGYNFSSTDSTTVAYNGEFSFKVDIDDAHKKDTNFKVTAAGGTLTENADGTYRISNITDDVAVNVSGVVDSTSKVDITSNEHAEVKVTSDNADAIKYGGTVTFTVAVKSGYRIENVFVNGENRNALNGKYTVNNITSDVTIDVVTVANKLTVNYVSTEKNHTVDKTATYTIENISTVLSEKLDDCIVHSFNGWNYNDTKADANTVDTLKALIAQKDNTATLTAEFGLKDDKAIADALLNLAKTTKERTQVGDKYRTTFRTVINIIEAVDADVDPCVMDYVKVTAHGTLLANRANVDFETMTGAVENRKNKNTSETVVGVPIEGENVFNYYVNCNYTWSTFYSEYQNPNNREIVLRITSSYAETSLNAAGWVELSIGDTSIYIISGESGQEITVAAK